MNRIFFFFAVTILISAGTPLSSADAADVRAITEALSVTITPEFPKPNDNVNIHIESNSVNLNTSSISWVVNGKEVSSGQGNNSATFTLGGEGSGADVVVFIQPSNGNSFSKNFFIAPTDMDILWEASTYTPPFYKGKALFTGESDLSLVALPVIYDQAGNPIPRNTLVYQWKLNGKVLVNQSGYGKSSATITGSLWKRPERVNVTASTADGRITTQKEVVINPTDPKVLVYENHPLLGLLTNHAVTDVFTLKEAEVSFAAIPYFFSDARLGVNTIFAWKMNKRAVETNGNANQITFRNDGPSGRSEVSVAVSQPGKIFQNAEESFLIRYGN